MGNDLQSVVVAKSSDGLWIATHVPSGKKASGNSPDEASDAMRLLLGMTNTGSFEEPITSDRFADAAKSIALFLEGPVSEALAFHSGWARLTAFEAGIAHIRLGGGCQGCPSSQITLFNGVRTQLQSRFGEDTIMDVVPAVDE